MMCQALLPHALGHLHSAHACLLLSRGLTSTGGLSDWLPEHTTSADTTTAFQARRLCGCA